MNPMRRKGVKTEETTTNYNNLNVFLSRVCCAGVFGFVWLMLALPTMYCFPSCRRFFFLHVSIIFFFSLVHTDTESVLCKPSFSHGADSYLGFLLFFFFHDLLDFAAACDIHSTDSLPNTLSADFLFFFLCHSYLCSACACQLILFLRCCSTRSTTWYR